MKTSYGKGANYIQIEGNDTIDPKPLRLGPVIINPGDKITRIGSKNRTSFEMRDGYHLIYLGVIDNHLVFDVGPRARFQKDLFPENDPFANFYYSFTYVSPECLLLQGSKNGFYDIIPDVVDMTRV
jgi:hypothetical protein